MTWITDRTQDDVDRVKELAEKAKAGTWTEDEQAEWAAGMKGALSYTDYNRIENGMKELAGIVGAEIKGRTVVQVVDIVTAKDDDGNTPAWDTTPSKVDFFLPLIVKRSGLALHALHFEVNGYMAGTLRIDLRKYGSEDALISKTIDIVRGSNELTVEMDDFPLEIGVEYQLYLKSPNKFYLPSVEPAWVIQNDYVDIATGSAYYDDNSKAIFSGKISFAENVPAEWDVNGYLTVSDASHWLENVAAIRKKCGGRSTTPSTPDALSYDFKVINQVEKVLADIEQIAKDHLYYCSDLICGGEPYYAIY